MNAKDCILSCIHLILIFLPLFSYLVLPLWFYPLSTILESSKTCDITEYIFRLGSKNKS